MKKWLFFISKKKKREKEKKYQKRSSGHAIDFSNSYWLSNTEGKYQSWGLGYQHS